MKKTKKENESGSLSKHALSSVFSLISRGTERVVSTIEDKALQMERRITQHAVSVVLMLCGGLLLVCSAFFFMTESLGWSNASALLCLGLLVLIAGIIVKLQSDAGYARH